MKAFARRVDAHMRKRKADLRAAGPKHAVSATRKEKMKERARMRKAKKRGTSGAVSEDGGDDDEERAEKGGSAPLAGQKRPRESEAPCPPAAVKPHSSGAGRPAGRTHEFPTDLVAFGERAMQPPTLAVIPRAKVRRSP